MTDVYRLKVVFINKETMTKIEDVHRIIVRPTYDGELIATYYDENDDSLNIFASSIVLTLVS